MNRTPESSTVSTSLKALQEALETGAMRQLRRMVNSLNPGEIADLLESLPPAQRRVVWELISTEDEGDVLVELNEEVRATLIGAMKTEELVAATANLELDDLADLLAELPEAINREVLRSLDASDRLRLQSVLKYDEDSAGGLMNPETVTVRADVTLEVVLRYLRIRGKLPDGMDAVFVVNRRGDYLGSLPLTRLVTADLEARVADVMDKNLPVLDTNMEAAQVATLFENYDLILAPVIDDQGKLVGRINVDDVLDVIREEASHSVLSMAGLDEDDDMFAPIATSARRRSIWLGVNLATAFLAAWVAGLFEATLDQVVMLAILMPVVPSMGGVAGTQTLILITRGIALGQIERANARWLLQKEVGVGLLNAAGWAIVVALVTSWWFGTWKVGAVMALALSVSLLFAAISGFLVPVCLKRLRIDPALAGGVVLTTITDVVGLVSFLGIGTLVLL
ncbi:MAG TPA: magnesium transporter [Gammaproteobacteria bacterium]|nr:magnesium transporter [Gammaproteobacteria bacterium]